MYRIISFRCCTGANASAEEAAEALEEGAQSVINAVSRTSKQEKDIADSSSHQVHSFRLQSTQFDKKSYLTYLKASFVHTSAATSMLMGFPHAGIHEERKEAPRGKQARPSRGLREGSTSFR